MSARSRRTPTDEIKTKVFDEKTELDGAPPEPQKPTKLPVLTRKSEPMLAISMKASDDLAEERPARPEVPKVQLRSIAETHAGQKPAPGFGRLAPPRDAREARGRRIWSNMFYASIAVIIASLVALAVWLIAGRR